MSTFVRLVASRRYLGRPTLALLAVGIVVTGTVACSDSVKRDARHRQAKLPPLPVDPFSGLDPLGRDKPQPFLFRTGPKPPPSITKTVGIPFPPEVASAGSGASHRAKPDAKPGPLEVIRHQPTGAVKNVGAVSISFNQPMVPLADLKRLRSIKVPVTISPQPEGRWRWLGTRTLAFEPAARMPYATRYTVRVAQGARSAIGSRLERAFSFSFTTPRPKIVMALPNRYSTQTRPDTAIALLFNQRIDKRQLRELLALSPGGFGPDDLELVPAEKWAQLRDIGSSVASWDAARTIVLQPKRPLSRSASQQLTIKAGLRGEGERLANTLFHTFRTYSPLRVEWARCRGYRCDPKSGFYVRFNNPLVTRNETMAKLLSVSPVVPGLEIWSSGQYLNITGQLRAQTSYTLELAPGVVDIHDQTLKKTFKTTLKTGSLKPLLTFPVKGTAALERTGSRLVPVEVQNVQHARLRMVRVTPANLQTLLHKARYGYWYTRSKDPLAGIKDIVVRRQLRTGAKPDMKATLGISTDEALGKGGSGALYVELFAPELRRDYRYANVYRSIMVQVSDLAVMARFDNDRLVALVSHMQTGQPLALAKVALYDKNGRAVWRGTSDGDGLVRAPGGRAIGKGKRNPPYSLWVQKGRDQTFVLLAQGHDGVYSSSYASAYLPPKTRLKMHLFTDRSPYRPGEIVHVKGILRLIDLDPKGGVEALPTTTKARYRIRATRGRVVKKGELTLTKSGSFAFDVKLPADADLGRYTVLVTPTSGSHRGTLNGHFDVEEYRPPELKVKVQTPAGPFFIGQTLAAKVGADYLFGAPMSGAPVSWSLTRKATTYDPPNNPGYRFGQSAAWRPGYHYLGLRGSYRGGYQSGIWGPNRADGTVVKSGSGFLGPDGLLGVETKLEHADKKWRGALSFTLEATVHDKNRQTISDRQTLIAHPASVYAGLKPEKTVVKAGETLAISTVLVDLAGKRVGGKNVSVEALAIKTKVRPVFENNRWVYKWDSQQQTIASCQIVSADRPRTCSVKLPRPGSYIVRARAKDPTGRPTTTSLRVYAYGDGYVPWRLKNQSQIELVADKKSYRPGDTARILVKSPLREGIGLLTYDRGGIEHIERISIKGSARVIEVPIKRHHVPALDVSIALGRGRSHDTSLGKAARDLGRPTFAQGSLRLPVVLDEKRVSIDVEPDRKTLAPAESFTLRLQSKDWRGKPVPAELAVMVVDEGVLALMGYKTPDPTAVFWAGRGRGAPLVDSRNDLLGKRKLERVAGARAYRHGRRLRSARAAAQPRASNGSTATSLGLSGYGRGGGGTGYGGIGLGTRGRISREKAASGATASDKLAGLVAPAQPVATGSTHLQAARIRARSHFATTAFYAPSVQTDEQGHATLTVKMPDNLTTFRIMVVAIDRSQADRFGKGESQVQVRKPLLLRPSLPRFLSVGDRFEAAVVVHNETDKTGLVDVLVRGRNARTTGENRRRVEVAAHGAKEVRFAMVAHRVGPARVQFAAVLGAFRDGVEKQLPVYLPVTTEAFATYGMTSRSVAQPVKPPKGARHDYGGLDISFSSSALNGLEDSVRYLVSYPHECTEQTASRVIPIFALKDILRDFGIGKLADLKKRASLARSGVRKLLSYQRYDGGWGFWGGSPRSSLYISAYATMALFEAKHHGHDVDRHKLDRARRFLKYRLDYPYWYERLDWVGQTAAAWVLSSLKQYEKKHLSRLYGLHKSLPIFARAWLMQALYRSEGRSGRVKELLRQIDNAAVQTPSAARFAEGDTESLRLLMHTNDRTDAIVLSALLEVAPHHALLPKVARGLLQARLRGHWSTTQSNAYALMALSRYYKQVEKTVPAFTSQIWYGQGYMGQAAFKGREMKTVRQTIPMAALLELGSKSLVLAKNGPGKLYYRIGLRYAPGDLSLPPEEQGFSVSRRYEAIPARQGRSSAGVPSSRTQRHSPVKQLADGSWTIKAGTTVRVRVTVVVPDNRFFVAITDPLPAGLEPINFRFKTSAQARLSRHLDSRTHSSWSWYALSAFDHRELHDERVAFYADRLPAGVYEYTYLARATTYGSFVAGPSKAEEMYRPETFGRSGTTRVKID